ncbi:hypothetical protein LSCM1_00070 [Leishmania martiniquensis]|uniref:Uncharacterized protein n=1 Tax=Leishmania martiniquensis TaxID=1580590 RepID=A0A836K9J0_9TRYP|nr:hypothetical protein LSCM1_00070 [Leishmania martiniquensis]
MFSGFVATASHRSDDHKSGGEAAPLSALFSPRPSSASSSAGGSSGRQHRRQQAGSGEGPYPRVSPFSPFVGTEFSSPQADCREQRSDSAEYLTPFSAPGGCASVATVTASPSSDRAAVYSPSLQCASGSPYWPRALSALGHDAERQTFTSYSSPSPLHHDGKASTGPARTPTPRGNDDEPKASSVAGSAPPSRDTAFLPENSARQAVDSLEASADSADFAVMRSGTREGRQRSSQLSSSSPSSTPCAPPQEESPVGGVVAAERHAPAPRAPASPLRFSMMYREEEHRVRLETLEMEERRCLYRAHKAVLLVYRMWAAESNDKGYGEEDNDGLRLVFSQRVDEESARLLEDCVHPNLASTAGASAAGFRAHLSSPSTATAAATKQARCLLSSSIDCPRGRRGAGADLEADAAGCVRSHRSMKPCILSGGSGEKARCGSPGHQLPHQISNTSSPAASRMLDYSMQVPDAAPALTYTSSKPPSLGHHTRLFSPWRTARFNQHDADTWSSRSSADTHADGRATRAECFGGSPKQPRRSRVPHLVSTSFAALHLSSGSSLTAEHAALWRQSPPELRSWADIATPRKDRSRGTAVHAARAAAAAETPSLSHSTGLSPPRLRGLSGRSAVPTERCSEPQTTPGPLWNASGNLSSTSAANRCTRPLSNMDSAGNRVAGGATDYASNESFRLRQPAALSGTGSGGRLRSPCDGIERDLKMLRAAQRLEDHPQEQLCSYLQYRRFFDAVYGEQSASPPSSREPDTRQRSGGRTSPVALRTAAALPPSHFSVGDEVRGVSSWLRRPCGRVAHRGVSQSCSGRAAGARCAWSPLSQEPTTASTRLTNRVAWRKGRGGQPTASHNALFAARLTRLFTLEKLCRAELQRRCMEDQSVLLHHFIVEGTAALQRNNCATAPLNQHRPRFTSGMAETYAMVPTWTCIPNEVDEM